MRILIVEDKEKQYEFARNELGAEHALEFASTFEAARDALTLETFDALLTDHMVAEQPLRVMAGQQVRDCSPLIELATSRGMKVLGVFFDPVFLDDGVLWNFKFPVVGSSFNVGPMSGGLMEHDRPPYAPKPWGRLFANSLASEG